MPKNKRLISLRLLVFLLIGISLTIFSITFFYITHTNMTKMLLQSEDRYLNMQLEVVKGLFQAAMYNSYRMADDVGIWDETVEFAQGKNPDYIKNNWPDSSPLENYRFNFLIFKDIQGNSLYTEFFDYIDNKALPTPEGFTEHLNQLSQEVLDMYKGPQFPAGEIEKLGKGGIFFYKDIPYFACAMPIMLSRESGNPAGTVILGYILNNNYFRNLTHYNTISFKIVPSSDLKYPTKFAIDRKSDEVVATSMSLRDLNGSPLLLNMSDNRIVYAEGQSILSNTIVLIILAIFFLSVVLYQIIIRFVLHPIEYLNKDIGNIASTGYLDINKYSKAKEFITLCLSINDMLQRLNQSKISIDVLQRILNEMNSHLYVSDPETDILLFVNDKLAEDYGIKGNAVGQFCWKVLQRDKNGRCDLCPNHELIKSPDAAVVWENYSDITDRHYRITDSLIEWADHKKAHLQHRVDITDIKLTEAALKKRLEQQELMFSISQSFISTVDMPTLIRNALQMTGEFLNVSKVLITRLNESTNMLDVEYEWYNKSHDVLYPENISFPFSKGEIEYNAFITEKLSFLVFEDLTQMEGFNSPAHYEIKTFMRVPIYVFGAFWGILSFDECQNTRAWTESDIQLAKLIATVISGVIERHLTEEKLVRMSSIVNSSPQYISYINVDGDFEYFNQGALDILGYTEEEILSGNISAIFDSKTVDYIKKEVIPRIMDKGKFEFEASISTKNGQIRTMLFSAFKTNSLDVGAIASDITEKLLLEKELIMAKEEAVQSNLAKSEFLSRMSHEMRTPMNAIIGMTGIAKSTQDLEKKEYCLDKIDEASKHLLGVINDILDMSKIEANKFELSIAEFNFEKMLMRVVNVVNFRVEEKHQTLIIDIHPAVPVTIVSDEQRLAQVIANLMSNAVKFTPEKGLVTLIAKKIAEEDDLCTLQIEVKDTGIGITPEQQSKLFRSFEQADGGISRRFGGTGLGLAISKRIVEMMGGEIFIESEIDKGSSFIFTMKAARGFSEQPSLLDMNVSWKDLRILVVDDAPEVRDYFVNVTETINIYCDVAEDGFEACKLIEENKNNPYHIIFVDWKMPGMNGIELTERIKNILGANVVVIMISATEWNDIKHDALTAGVDRFIPKPLFSSHIVDCINDCMSPQSSSKDDDNLHSRTAENFEKGCFAGHRILLAEDIEINQEIVISLLEDTGIEIDCAENGLEAYQMFKENPSLYDVIFMDIHMPEVDGYEATRMIRQLNTQKALDIPIIAMTANVFREDIEKCLEAGMNDHIGKPIDTKDIFDKLQKNLKKKNSGQKF